MDHDLLQSQIRDSCKLALPEGLKDLMCDISREVLRAKPSDIYHFIANYLSALMVTRDHLTVATQLYSGEVSIEACHMELRNELFRCGLDADTVEEAREIITEYLENGGKTEVNLMQKLTENVNLQDKNLDAVKYAVHNAFKRYLSCNTTVYESSSDSDIDEVDRAAKHTLNLYRRTDVSDGQYMQTSDKVKVSYRAYGIQRRDPSEGSTDSS